MTLWQNIPFFCILLPLGSAAMTSVLKPKLARRWTLMVLWTVQQVEGSFLSPRLLSGATRLHPLTVLLAISAGGIFSGTLGMLLALPVVVSIRGAMRGLRR